MDAQVLSAKCCVPRCWVLCSVLVLGAAVVVGMWMRGLTGATSLHGLATPAQAAEALGVPRLRKSADVVRPDLYARSQRRGPVRSKRRAANQPEERTL